jgi:hypothetical protein
MKVKIGDHEVEIRPFTFGEHKRMLAATGLKWTDEINEKTIGQIVKFGLQVQHGITVTEDELDALPSRRVQRMVVELLRDRDSDGEEADPFGMSSTSLPASTGGRPT